MKSCPSDTGGPLRSPSAGIRACPRASRQHSEIPQPQRPQPRASRQGIPRTPAPRGPWQPPTPPTDELPTEQFKGLSVAPVWVLATTRRKTTHADQQVLSAQHLPVLQPSNQRTVRRRRHDRQGRRPSAQGLPSPRGMPEHHAARPAVQRRTRTGNSKRLTPPATQHRASPHHTPPEAPAGHGQGNVHQQDLRSSPSLQRKDFAPTTAFANHVSPATPIATRRSQNKAPRSNLQ